MKITVVVHDDYKEGYVKVTYRLCEKIREGVCEDYRGCV